MAGRTTVPRHRYPGLITCPTTGSPGVAASGRRRVVVPARVGDGRIVSRQLAHRLVGVGIEGLAHRVDPLEALLGQDIVQLAGHRHQGAPVSRLGVPEVLGGQIQRVQHGQHLLHQGHRGAGHLIGLLLDHPLLVVLELGLQTSEGVEVLVALVEGQGQRIVLGEHVVHRRTHVGGIEDFGVGHLVALAALRGTAMGLVVRTRPGAMGVIGRAGPGARAGILIPPIGVMT